MGKHLIIMHGRSIKPAEASMEKFTEEAVLEGLRRANRTSVADKIRAGDIKLSLAYYGDINNEIQAEHDKSDREALTAKDPRHGNGPALPDALIASAMARTKQSPKFTAATYRKVLAEANDRRLLDEAADFVSFVGGLFTFGWLNEKIIEIAKPDMAAYLLKHKTGSVVRSRLQEILLPSIANGDDICLLTHSMGCMVAYDVFWKISHQSEHANLLKKNNPVKNWITFGCPLGEKGVRLNLLDGHYSDPDDVYPRNVFEIWSNVWAEDDFISHVERMKKAFREMTKRGFVDEIKDHKIYNCWAYERHGDGELVANPHDFYGYLMHQTIGTMIGDWGQ